MKKFNVEGYIIDESDRWAYDFYGLPATSQQNIREFLSEAKGEDIELRIDSPGGIVRIASDIYSDLRDYEGNSTSNIIGISASASTIMMLGTKRTVASPTARFMIHLASGSAMGNYRDMQKASKVLRNADDSIISAYQIKTGKSHDELLAAMEKETWMTAQEAFDFGIIDEITLKEDETLGNMTIAAAADLNPILLHEIAIKFKDRETFENHFRDSMNESGGTSRPISDINAIEQQAKRFRELRRKIYS